MPAQPIHIQGRRYLLFCGPEGLLHIQSPRDVDVMAEKTAARLAGSESGLGGFGVLFEALTAGSSLETKDAFLELASRRSRRWPERDARQLVAEVLRGPIALSAEPLLAYIPGHPEAARALGKNTLLPEAVYEQLSVLCEPEVEDLLRKNPSIPAHVRFGLIRVSELPPGVTLRLVPKQEAERERLGGL